MEYEYKQVQNQTDWVEETSHLRQMYTDAMPEVMSGQDAVRDATYKDGAISRKMKHLIAMAIAIRIGCQRCIVFQPKLAIEQGATKEEILEAASVAIAMGGTPSIGWTTHIVKYLEEQGMM
ncbi:carboxymuconolactone decarboxylase family protein [Chloroflexota bacterium]